MSDQLTIEDSKTMSPNEVRKALAEGRFDLALGGKAKMTEAELEAYIAKVAQEGDH